jgi:hypothetical protein
MTVRGFDIYDQMVAAAAVPLQAPPAAPQAAAATATATYGPPIHSGRAPAAMGGASVRPCPLHHPNPHRTWTPRKPETDT